ncbi:MAG: hypothetical protein WCO00_09750 [Rhodospirillaceae bacterium]
MGTDTRRPLAWEILNKLKTSVKTGAANETERLSKDHQERQHSHSERLWWMGR